VATSASADLQGVWPRTATDVWAVGDAGTILRFDGGQWRPSTSGSSNRLRAVWGVADASVWAVGDKGTILHWDGGSWKAETSNTTDDLYSVWGTGAGDVWAAGGGPFEYAGLRAVAGEGSRVLVAGIGGTVLERAP
jgi:hypothetical protein